MQVALSRIEDLSVMEKVNRAIALLRRAIALYT